MTTTTRKPYASNAYIAWLAACLAAEQARTGTDALVAFLTILMREGIEINDRPARDGAYTILLCTRPRPDYAQYNPESPSGFVAPDDRPPGGRFVACMDEAAQTITLTNDPWHWDTAPVYPKRVPDPLTVPRPTSAYLISAWRRRDVTTEFASDEAVAHTDMHALAYCHTVFPSDHGWFGHDVRRIPPAAPSPSYAPLADRARTVAMKDDGTWE